ncbi:MAG: type I restriction enzyme HsdR N-terminal domain-containing protein, partial [Muribaculaceae bacterium]|nr:type I restriction enzyme HsdR N-terminal domain-containing protein [Muribaculaceae bacterium]
RRKYVALTPEEYVRQHFTSWLINTLHYPASNIANETGIRVNNTLKRCDTVVISRDGSPFMIVEYKAPGVAISQATFDQIVRYNMELQAKYLVVSNGLHHYCCMIDYDRDTYHFIPKVPDYNELTFLGSQN